MHFAGKLPKAAYSAVEYLTFITATGEGGVEAIYADENVWLSQKMMAELYDVNVRTINEHLKKIFIDSELDENSVIQNFRITAADGKTYDKLFESDFDRFVKLEEVVRVK